MHVVRLIYVLFLAVLENSVLPKDGDSLHETLKVLSILYQSLTRRNTPNGVIKIAMHCIVLYCNVLLKASRHKTLKVNVKIKRNNRNIGIKITIFPIISKKKSNQSSVSDEDREFPTLESMDNTGNS